MARPPAFTGACGFGPTLGDEQPRLRRSEWYTFAYGAAGQVNSIDHFGILARQPYGFYTSRE